MYFTLLKMEVVVEHHHNNRGVLVGNNGVPQDTKICWCRLHHLFKTRDLIEEVVLDHYGQPLHYYRLLNVPSELPLNKVVSQACKKTIRGPVYFCYDDRDTESREILDFLLSC